MNLEVEQNLLGMAMLDNNCAMKLMEVPENWFLLNAHKLIYREIGSLVSQSLSVDSIALGDNLLGTSERKNGLDMEYLMQLESSTTSLSHFDSYKTSLFKIYKKTSIERVGKTIEQKLGSGEDIQDIIMYMQEEVFNLLTDHNNTKPENISVYLKELTKKMQQIMADPDSAMGLKTGYEELDELIGGLQKKTFHLIAARPSIGKSAFGVVDLGIRVSQDTELPVAVFSFEMSGVSLAARAVCNRSGLNNNKIKKADLTSEEWTKFAQVVEVMDKRNNLYIDETHNLSTSQMRARLNAIKVKHGGIGAVFFDHVGLIKKNPKKSETEALTQISHELLGFTKDFDCPVVALSQLNRDVEKRPDKRPVMSDLKQSGALEEDADVIITLYRDDYYNKDTDIPNVTEVDIIKNRDGALKTLFFNHQLECSRYSPINGFVKPEKQKKQIGKF